MGYSLNIEQRGEYLHATVSGECTLVNVLSYFEEIYGACILYRCSNVLIEENLSGQNLDTFDIFVVITKNYQRLKNINVRLAYVDLNAKHDIERLKFSENLAHIRGINVKVFYEYNLQKMIAWLLDKETILY